MKQREIESTNGGENARTRKWWKGKLMKMTINTENARRGK